MNEYDRISKICCEDYSTFIDFDNVIGIASGEKIVNGVYTKKSCITVFVEKKIPLDALDASTVIPPIYKGIATDVVETGKITSLSLTDRKRPAFGGYSIGVSGSTAGTIACAACSENKDSLNYYLLSNNHVLADENRASIGSVILQPGPYDGSSTGVDIIGYLEDYEPLCFITPNRKPVNYVDCAIARCDPKNISSEIEFIGTIKGIDKATPGMIVKKTGRTSGLTSGKVLYTNASITVGYDNGESLFVNQIITSAMSQPGDSGSLLLDEQNNAIGLLFSGSDSISVFNPIDKVLSTLKIRLL